MTSPVQAAALQSIFVWAMAMAMAIAGFIASWFIKAVPLRETVVPLEETVEAPSLALWGPIQPSGPPSSQEAHGSEFTTQTMMLGNHSKEHEVSRAKKQWSDFSSGQQTAIVTGAFIEVLVTAAALRDLVKHPAEQVRGSKPLWGLAFVVQPFGPLAYYAFGRVNR